ncbi:MAG: ribose 5-phosphate isomerase B [Chloroflexi bacterium]|nr:ribose 5-phosphate isomerase B [Chloroflexota bacterium]
MKIAIGSDHAGFALKQQVREALKEQGYEMLDVGAHDATPSDYPDFAKAVGEAVQRGSAERGILICGSGVGACIAANKIGGVRAALLTEPYSARQGVQHDDMNVICMGARVVGPALAWEIVQAFLGATFQSEERFVRRLNKVIALEQAWGGNQKSEI